MSNSIENDSRQEDLQQEGSQMNDSTKCPQCGGEMPANFPPGVCPACLLMQGMSPSTLHGAEGAESGSGNLGQRRSWTPPTPAELAPRFPQWEIVELLGQGGMGAVYKVRQKDLDRWAALKVLPSDVANDPNFAERFQREARTLAQLSHQHIVTVYEFGQCDGVFYLLMEFVDGVTLRQAIRAGLVADAEAIRLSGLTLPAPSREETAPSTKPLEAPRHISPSAALGIVGQICDALQFAHEEGVVHRDIKPENILIDKRGRVKIADFGLAKLLGKQPHFPTLTGTHQIMGTPVYMAPEQMEGTKGVDHRADIFSLGVVFYELLTGELPLGRFAPPSQKYSLDVRLDEIVLRTLEKEPGRRYQQASEVKLDVETLRSQPVAAKPTKSEKPRQPWTVARLALLFLIVLMGSFAGLLGCLVLMSWLYDTAFQGPTVITRTTNLKNWNASQRAATLHEYIANVERTRLEQQRAEQQQADAVAATRDPNEVNALVQFTADGVKLHPNAFGSDEMSPAQRITLEKILTDIHRQYLDTEAKHRETTDENGVRTVTIMPFFEEFLAIEDRLWTMIDEQLPISVQKLLRERLPLYANQHGRSPLVAVDGFGMPGGSASGGGMSMSPGMGSMGGGAGMMVGGGNPETNLRYQQLLGWNQGQLPLRITFGRRGKWFTWSILQGHIRTSSVATYPAAAAPAQQAPAAITVQLDPFSTPMGLDSGEAPSLPSGLKRFWKDSKPGQTEVSPFSSSAGEPLFGTAKSYDEDSLPIGKRLNVTPGAVFAQAHEAYSAGEWEQYADCFTSMGRDEWTFGQLTGMTSLVEQLKERGLTTESLEPHLAATLVRCERFLASIDEAFPELPIKMQERTIRLKAVVSREFDDLQISRNARREARVKVIREVFGDQAREVFVLASKSFQSIKPDKTLLHNLTVLAPVDGGDNATAVTGTFGDDSSAMPSPIWFKRIKDKWLIDGLVDDIADRTLNFSMWVVTPSNLIPEAERGLSITEQLQQLDRLRAADQTPWDEIEKRTNELLAKYTAPADKGRIHWMAAHVYGQSDIRGHGADVTRHAQEALRYERDPVQRGWLYMYLGSAAGLVEKREEATRWHLKSYLELLPFNLPEIAPELPTVGKFRGERFGPTDGEVDPDQVAVEVLQAAEVRARKEAELIRDLVKSRNVTIGLLQDLYGREYQADSDATVALRKLATEVLRDEAIVLHLLQRVWPDSIPKS